MRHRINLVDSLNKRQATPGSNGFATRRFVLAALLLGWPSMAWGGELPRLGSPDFRPTMSRPLGWRGDGSGRFPGAAPAVSWSSNKNVRWSVRVGSAYSSPVVSGRYVLLTSEPDVLLCLDRSQGRECWKAATKPDDVVDEAGRKSAAAYVPPKNGAGLAAATPLTDGQRVYAVFANGLIRAWDLDGRSKWIACIGAEQDTAYGRSSSPIMVSGKLIVHLTHLCAFDPVTGARLWANPEAKATYGTPAALRLGDVDYIVTPSGDVVRADNGKTVLSRVGRCQYGTPLVSGDVVYFADRSVQAVRLTAGPTAQDLWESELSGEVFGSPVLHEGMLFVTTGQGELYAFDTRAQAPQRAAVEARALFGDSESSLPVTYSSLTLAGKYLFLTSNKGVSAVLGATPEANLIGTNTLPGGSGASPVFCGREMFVRDGDSLYCIQSDAPVR